MTMSRNIHMYHLRGNEQSMISMDLIGFKEGDTLLSLRQKLEGIRIFESTFQFWDNRLRSLVHTKLEALIFVEDLEGKVVLFETKDSEESNLVLVGPRVKTEPPVIGTQPVERNVIYKEQNEGIVDVSIGSSKPSITGDDRLEGKALFLSKRMSHAVETAWREQVERLIIWQQKENKVDHEWRVRTWDEGECVVGVFECLECRCFLGRPDRGEEKATVQNVFIYYCNKHIGCEKHVANWRRRRNLPKRRSKFELVSSKKNLEHNLREHLSFEKHRENVEFLLCSTSHGPVRSGAKGRPKKFDPRDLKRQRCIDSFFVGAQSSGSVSNPFSTEDCEKEPCEVHSDLSLLCWGFWFASTAVYGGNVYDVKPLLDDQKRGCTCACYNIPKTSSFKFQCTREDDAAVKRGSRDSLLRIKLDYLTILELRVQAQCRARARRKEHIELFKLKRRVCTLMSRTCKVAQIAGESAKWKDIVNFLRNIYNAHKNGAFGGREALWEFLCDVGRNMNRAAKGYRYSKSTQAIQQALFQFGGRRVVNCMSMNLLTPSLRTVKRNRSTFVPFLCGLQDSNFKEVAKILTAAKALHGIIGDVAVILAEDKT
ncbi:hypothetical protein R1flu_014568 [Riccia fluitans]|uniref:Transposase n=1 Tax=Riccia fluitans TaxID=41844 RepID=A0ABD1YGK6_9MARC